MSSPGNVIWFRDIERYSRSGANDLVADRAIVDAFDAVSLTTRLPIVEIVVIRLYIGDVNDRNSQLLLRDEEIRQCFLIVWRKLDQCNFLRIVMSNDRFLQRSII